MELNLCEIFKVKENQHFWVKEHDDEINEYFVSNNKLYIDTKDFITEMLCFNLMEVKEIYYTKPKQPIQLTKNTKTFLKLINKDYTYIAREESKDLYAFINKPIKMKDLYYVKSHSICSLHLEKVFIDEEMFDIDLSFIKWEDEEPTLISDLIGEE